MSQDLSFDQEVKIMSQENKKSMNLEPVLEKNIPSIFISKINVIKKRAL